MSESEFRSLKLELKKLFTGYKRLTPVMISKMTNLGFRLEREKKALHFSLLYGQ